MSPRPWQGIIGAPKTAEMLYAYCQTLQMRTWRPSFVVVHNTGIPTFRDWHKVPGPVRMHALEGYYRDVKKWSAGPHLFVADDYIWLFTPLWTEGVHAPSWNHVSWGVETVSDLDSEPLNPNVYLNLVSALAILHNFGGLDPNLLRFHKEDPKTTHYGCPGKNMQPKPVLISDVATERASWRFA